MNQGLALTNASRLRILTSACLLGQKVRYNGDAKTHPWLLSELAPYANFTPLCPEVAMGLGVPRPTLHLYAADDGLRLINKAGSDFTVAAQSTAAQLLAATPTKLDAIILTSGSPTCGPRLVKVYDHNGAPERRGVGLFAQAVAKAYPLTPLIESGHLNNPLLREKFLLTIFTLRRFTDLKLRISALQEFQRTHKFLLRLYNIPLFNELGQIVGASKRGDQTQLFKTYHQTLFALLQAPLQRGVVTDSLTHMYGFMKDHLKNAHKQQVLTSIADYEQGLVNLAVPLTLIGFIASLYHVTYIEEQAIFHPYPKSLGLCNHL